MSNEEYPLPGPSELKGRGSPIDWLLPEKVKELLKHVTVDEATGKRTVTLPNFTITFDAPE